VLRRDDVRALLDLDDLIDALRSSMVDLRPAARRCLTGSAVSFPGKGRLMAMPGYVPSQGALVSKLVSLFSAASA
jgi:alanine dehydrogenase